ncbi:MAG: LPS export ABC transporter periplasmic protein LptC [Alphaproteobacteria bacterium]|nr:LPS export ABC transporter periplasmic protein LptC [Alphaproteobacteria bacterium]
MTDSAQTDAPDNAPRNAPTGRQPGPQPGPPTGLASAGVADAPDSARVQIPLGARSTRIDPTYGRIVQFLKVALPTVAVLLIGLLLAWPQISEHASDLIPSILDTASIDSMQVANARYQGVDDQNQPYIVTADTVRQTSVDSPEFLLDGPKADIALKDESWAALTALEGVFDRERQILILEGDVSLFHDLGYEFKTDNAIVDIAAGEASGDSPVQGQGPFGEVDAEGFRIFEKGARVVLTGKTKLVINP